MRPARAVSTHSHCDAARAAHGALGVTEWGDAPYTTHPADYWRAMEEIAVTAKKVNDNGNDDDDSDAPYFSLVTGKYDVSQTAAPPDDDDAVDLTALPGRGALAAAADFLQQ